MPDLAPKILKNEIYQLLREEKIDEANARLDSGERCDLTGAFLRGCNLQGLHATNINFADCYFRLADLRGVDFRHCCMEGASIHGAKIHGAYFPVELSAEEIMMSIKLGTRMRYNSQFHGESQRGEA
jgi:uncharacterized protein YjbI with pentapeptide repeats